MPLHLTLENETSLPDGGPVSFTVAARRGIDIGRDQYLDWVLPDPTRSISGKHCEIRYRDGRYWLTDVSTNGTFVNRSEFRLGGPHALAHGDRIEIGRYIIAVSLEPDADISAAGAAPSATPAQPGELWSVGEAAPAINPRELRSPVVAAGIGSHDVLDWATSLPPIEPAPSMMPAPVMAPPQMSAPAPVANAMDWGSPAIPQPSRPAPQPPPVAAASAMTPQAQLPPAARQPAPMPAAPAPAPASPSARGGFAWDLDSDPGLPPVQSVPAPRHAEASEAADLTFRPGSDRPLTVGRTPGTVREAQEQVFDTPASQPMAPPAYQPPPAAEQRPVPPMPAAPPFAPAMPAGGASSDEILRRFAHGAGIPVEILRSYDAGQLAEILGGLMRTTVESVRQLQSARSQSKGLMRSANHTVIEATGNNPMKFSPTTEEALKIMFGPRTSSYLGAGEALDQSFGDVKRHQLLLFTAMQSALRTLLNDLEPEKIEASMEDGRGIASLLQSRKAKLWERYETRWKAKVGNNEQGMLGVFMLLFAEAYDRSGN